MKESVWHHLRFELVASVVFDAEDNEAAATFQLPRNPKDRPDFVSLALIQVTE